MKRFFKAVRKGDIDEVRALLRQNPALVHATAKKPPKKDDGQSALQVAFKAGQFDIADLLVDGGADVDFIESESGNEWKAPVLHDALRACVFSSRNPGVNGVPDTRDKFERALASLKKLLAAGADVGAVDSYGNTCGIRVAMDCNQLAIADHNRELLEDLGELFELLKASGVDFRAETATRDSPLALYGADPVGRFLR
jgi:ankyrin repeat protein